MDDDETQNWIDRRRLRATETKTTVNRRKQAMQKYLQDADDDEPVVINHRGRAIKYLQEQEDQEDQRLSDQRRRRRSEAIRKSFLDAETAENAVSLAAAASSATETVDTERRLDQTAAAIGDLPEDSKLDRAEADRRRRIFAESYDNMLNWLHTNVAADLRIPSADFFPVVQPRLVSHWNMRGSSTAWIEYVRMQVGTIRMDISSPKSADLLQQQLADLDGRGIRIAYVNMQDRHHANLIGWRQQAASSSSSAAAASKEPVDIFWFEPHGVADRKTAIDSPTIGRLLERLSKRKNGWLAGCRWSANGRPGPQNLETASDRHALVKIGAKGKCAAWSCLLAQVAWLNPEIWIGDVCARLFPTSPEFGNIMSALVQSYTTAIVAATVRKSTKIVRRPKTISSSKSSSDDQPSPKPVQSVSLAVGWNDDWIGVYPPSTTMADVLRYARTNAGSLDADNRKTIETTADADICTEGGWPLTYDNGLNKPLSDFHPMHHRLQRCDDRKGIFVDIRNRFWQLPTSAPPIFRGWNDPITSETKSVRLGRSAVGTHTAVKTVFDLALPRWNKSGLSIDAGPMAEPATDGMYDKLPLDDVLACFDDRMRSVVDQIRNPNVDGVGLAFDLSKSFPNDFIRQHLLMLYIAATIPKYWLSKNRRSQVWLSDNKQKKSVETHWSFLKKSAVDPIGRTFRYRQEQLDTDGPDADLPAVRQDYLPPKYRALYRFCPILASMVKKPDGRHVSVLAALSMRALSKSVADDRNRGGRISKDVGVLINISRFGADWPIRKDALKTLVINLPVDLPVVDGERPDSPRRNIRGKPQPL